MTTAADVLGRWGAAIRARRRALNMSQAQLAEAAGVHQTAISQAERGLIQLSLGSRIQIAAALEISHDDLFAVDGGAAA